MSCGKSCNCASYRTHLLSISVAPSATPSRFPQSAGAKEVSKSWEKDLPAYKRLVESGLQPPSTSGTYELEAKAKLAIEVETGTVLTNAQRKQYQSVTS